MAELRNTGSLKLDINGTEAVLSEEDLLIDMAQTEGYVSDGDNEITVVLDTKLTPELIAQMEDDETWLTAEECISYGLADRFADQDADMSNAAAVLQKANLNLEQRIKVQTSLAAQLRALVAAPNEGSRADPPVSVNPIMKLFERRSR